MRMTLEIIGIILGFAMICFSTIMYDMGTKFVTTMFSITVLGAGIVLISSFFLFDDILG